MHSLEVNLPLWLQVFATFGWILLMVWMLRDMTWDELFVPGRLQHWAVATLALLVIWNLRVEAIDGLAIHFLGLATVTLVFGWRLAIVMASIVIIALGIVGHVEWFSIPLTILTTGVLPVAVTWALLRFSERRLPPHMFIYLYFVGFLGGALSVLVVMSANAFVFALFTDADLTSIFSEYLQYLLLMVMPEGFLNGMVITALVMFRPEWVTTYSDSRYIDGR
jgi:uncharacterized membrane protein